MESGAEVLKSDTRGRLRMTAERREALLDEFERSGLSGVAFARMAGLKYVTFAQWAAKRRKERGKEVGNGVVKFLEAEVRGPEPEVRPLINGAGLVIELPGGSRLRVEGAVQLVLAAELIKLLGASRSKTC